MGLTSQSPSALPRHQILLEIIDIFPSIESSLGSSSMYQPIECKQEILFSSIYTNDGGTKFVALFLKQTQTTHSVPSITPS